MRPAISRVISLAAACAWREALRAHGHALVVTNGCYDILHAGHVAGLEAARREGDALLVLVNDDAAVRALKGAGRPIHDQVARATVLASLRQVDAVVIFAGADCARELAALAPDLYAKSEEYRGRQHHGEWEALKAAGTEIVWLPRDPRYSTTAAVAAGSASGGRGVADSPDPACMGTPADSLPDGRPSPARPSAVPGTAGEIVPTAVRRAAFPSPLPGIEIPRHGNADTWGVP